MKTINNFLLEKLRITATSKLKKGYTLPVYDYDTGKVDETTVWRKIDLPEKQYVIYLDKYRRNAPHFSDFLDFLASIMFFEDDYEDFDPDKDILYASDDLQDTLEWYFKNIYKTTVPDERSDVDDWIDSVKVITQDSPQSLFNIYLGFDDYYNDMNVNFSNKDKILKRAIDLITY